MSKTVIKVDNISKRYRLGAKEKKPDTLAGTLANIFKAPISNFKQLRSLSKFNDEDETTFWALRDVSFEVKEGEVLGIIGKNGAGKSTLLKILSQITEPTSGKIEIMGRVASLLEVGTGFHPELSGRDNIYMNGTILGMTKKEIDKKLDEIVDFSGVEKFIDTPVKFYSSGMKVRLGFSVAAHLEPEILIIDEVLAVGDYEFQKKCLGKMEDVASHGRTVLFVSHNISAIKKLCTNSILLVQGEKRFEGNVRDGISAYKTTVEERFVGCVFENDDLKVTKAWVSDESGVVRSVYSSLETLVFRAEVFLKRDFKKGKFCIDIQDQEENLVVTSFHNDVELFGDSDSFSTGKYELKVNLPPRFFNSGEYSVGFNFGIHRERWVMKVDSVCGFAIDFVIPNPTFSANVRKSVIAPILNWDLKF